MPSRPSALIGWISGANPHDGPSGTLQTNGFAGGDQPPNRFLNWLLLALTTWIDDWLYPIAAEYRHTRLYNDFRIAAHWDGTTYAQPCWEIQQNSGAGNVGYPTQNAQQSAESAGSVVYELHLPTGARTLQSVQVRLKPATGHSATPDAMPKMRIKVTDIDGTAASTVTTSDTVATAGSSAGADITNYEAPHWITHNSLALAIDPTTQRVVVEVYGETGTGTHFKSGLECRGLLVQYDFDLQDDVIVGSPEN